jgi:hypothetical protein
MWRDDRKIAANGSGLDLVSYYLFCKASFLLHFPSGTEGDVPMKVKSRLP